MDIVDKKLLNTELPGRKKRGKQRRTMGVVKKDVQRVSQKKKKRGNF